MVVEVFNDLDLNLFQEMAAGLLMMYNATQMVLRCCQTIRSKALPNILPYLPKRVNSYRVSVKSLFIFEIFEETLRSIVRSPISTTKPPLISGFTFGMTLSFLP